MKMKMIAIALAGFAAASAHAQSNVTIYGTADVSMESVKATGGVDQYGSRSRLNGGSSLIGFRGAEDLGSGLKAVFQIETAVNMDSNAGNGNSSFGASRDSYVGLNGGFGTVALGYLSHPYRSEMLSYDPVPGDASVGRMNGVMGSLNGGFSPLIRTQAAAYVSPTWNGFSGSIAYTGNESKSAYGPGVGAGGQNPYGYSGSVNWTNGQARVSYAHTTGFDLTGVDSKQKADMLAASYNFGQGTTVGAVVERLEDNTFGGADQRRNAWGLNAKHAMGQHEFAAAYYKANDVRTQAGNLNDTGASQVVLRYGYNLSKRTQVYGVYSQINNQANANYDFAKPVQTDGTLSTSGNDPRAIGVGLRHSF